MADLGNQLEGAGSGLERLTEGFDNLVIKLSGVSALEARIIKEKQAINKQLNKIDRDKAKEEKKALPLQKKMTGQLQQRLKNTTLLNKGLKETVKGMKLYEKSLGKLKSGVGGMGKGIAKMGAAVGKAGAIGGLVIAVKFLIDGLLKVDNAMAGLVKRTKLTRQELAGVREAALAAEQSVSLMGPSFEEITAEAGNLVETFGSAHMVTTQLIKDSLALQKGYGVAASEAGKLTEALARSAKDGEAFRQSIVNIAGKDGTSASLLMRSLAGQAQQVAIQSERGVEALAEMASNALAAGVSMNEIQGMKSAFQDIDTIAANMGEAGAIMGEQFRNATKSAEQYYALNLKGATGRKKIQDDFIKGMKAATYLDEQGQLRMKDSRELLSEMEGYIDKVAGAYGHTTEAAMLLTKRAHKPLTDAQKEQVLEAERLETIYRDQLGILEYFQKIVTSVFGKITTSFSEALGLDQSEGGVRGLLTQLEKDIAGVFSFDTLRADVAAGGGGFDGWVSAMMTRLNPLFDYVQDKMMLALEKAFDWIGENVNFNASALIPGVGGPLFSTKESEARERIADLQDQAAGGPLGGGYKMDYGGEYMDQAYTDMGFGDAEARQWAKKQLEEGVDLDKVTARAYKKSIADTKWVKEQIEKDPSLSPVAALGTSPADKRKRVKDSLALAAQWQQDRDAAAREKKAEEEKKKAAAKPSALGRIGGGLSLVGEAGGEVVISRSALRSGIGVGGRAASALAGIGVPGFREGYARADLSGVHGRQGLMGAQGSQAFRSARASAFQAEQARQQAAMMEYWRQHYENKMDDMVDEKVKQPPWLAKFFLKHNKQIGAVLNQTLGKKAFGKEMTTAIMQGMTNWSKGGSLKDSLRIGIKAGVVAGLNDPESSLNKFLKQQGAMGNIAKAGLAAYAGGKDVKRAVVSTGARELASYIQGGGTFGFGKPKKAAKGQYVNSPTLMMVGEEGRGEVVVPTERIRKGLPINKGVANELGSIGVPGFDGKNNSTMATWTPSTGEYSLGSKPNTIGGQSTMLGVDPGMVEARQRLAAHDAGKNITYGRGHSPKIGAKSGQSNLAGANRALLDSGKTGGSWEGKQNLDVMTPGSKVSSNIKQSYGGGVSSRFEGMGGWGGMAKGAAVGGLMDFANVYEQTGDWKQAASAGVGAGIGAAAGMGLTALGVPPPLSTMIGGAVGKLATRGINKVFKITGGYGEGRKRVMKLMESHIKSSGRFDFGAPSGLNKAMGQAIGGYEKTPTEANFNKMVEKMGTSSLIASMGVPAPALIALAQGKMNGGAAAKVYKTINTSLYGSGADKYRKALAIPALAAGGVVNRPTTALIGERGPEAVVPLGDSEMMKELKKQNKLMEKMIKTQEETGNPEIRLDGRVVSEVVGQNFYDIGNGI